MKSHLLVGERRVQSTVDRCSLLIPFRAIAGLPFNILQTLKIAAHFKCLFEFKNTSAAGGLQAEDLENSQRFILVVT